MSLAPYWEGIIEPILQAVRARSIVEIGADRGEMTRRLLVFARRHRAVLHVIDPAADFEGSGWRRASGGRLIHHRRPSLTALPGLGRYDVVLIDGDHNWYTVLRELRLIERASRAARRPWPVVLLHDVGWPYGRRDQYYEPGRIPRAHRRRWRRRGLHPERAAPLRHGGLNVGLCHAIDGRGRRNGVLTAVEDFQGETPRNLGLIVVPGFHGLGILFDRRRCRRNARLARVLDGWDLGPALRVYLERLERSRIHALLGVSASARLDNRRRPQYR